MHKSVGGRPAKDDKLMVEAMCFVLRTGIPWRDLPEAFGPWKSVYTRWRRWCRTGLWAHLFKKIAGKIVTLDPCGQCRAVVVNRHFFCSAKGQPGTRRDGVW